MIAKGLKSGFLVILLTLFVSTGLHTHSEKENRNFGEPAYSADQDFQKASACPVCQFQRAAHSFWNPGFQSSSSFPVFQREEFYTPEIVILASCFDPIRLGRAPPFFLPHS